MSRCSQFAIAAAREAVEDSGLDILSMSTDVGVLIASGVGVEEIRNSIGADSLAYVSLDGLIAASQQPKESLCRACFDGTYPIALPDEGVLGKHVLEQLQATSV